MTTEAALYNALKYRVVVDETGTRWYLNHNNKLHCEDGPAIEHMDGTKCWYRNGLRHREDGPAVIRPNGTCEWWLNGMEYTHVGHHAQLKVLGRIP